MLEKQIINDVLNILKINNTKFSSKEADEIQEKKHFLKTKDGQGVKSFIQALSYIGETSHRKGFTGKTIEEQASVYQWLEYCALHLNDSENVIASLNELNNVLEDKIYFVGNRFTIADFLLYQFLHSHYTKMSFQDKETFIHLSRWFRQVQCDVNAYEIYPKIVFTKTCLYS